MKQDKQKNRRKFDHIIDTIKNQHLFSETDYNYAALVLQKMIAGVNNYSIITDFKSSKNTQALKNLQKSLTKFDKNINKLELEQLEEILEHVKAINYLSSKISEAATLKSND